MRYELSTGSPEKIQFYLNTLENEGNEIEIVYLHKTSKNEWSALIKVFYKTKNNQL